MPRRPKIWIESAPLFFGVAIVGLVAIASPGFARSDTLAAPAESDRAEGEALQPPGAAGAGPRFRLSAVNIEGVTVYSGGELLALYEPLLDQEIALDEIFALANAVTARYRNDGYTLSRAIVPPQTIRAGRVRITVIEGFVDEVVIEGETRGRAGLFREWGEKIKASRPFNVAVLERYSLLANDLPGARVRAVVRPSEDTPGAAEVVLAVEHKTFDAAASLDNRAPKTTGPLQGVASVTGNSLLGLYDRTTLTYSSASERKHSQFFGLRHEQVLDAEGTVASVAASYSRSQPGDVLKDLDLISESTTLGFELTHPVIRSRDTNLTLAGGFTYREVDSDVLSAKLFRDRLSVLTLGGAYRFTDPWRGLDFVDLRIHKGLDILGASRSGDPFLTRGDGSGSFFKVTGSLSRTQHLGDGMSLFLAATGQYASTQLLASEEFGYGGPGFGRAYDPSEITGDHGVAVLAELRFTGRPDIPILNFYQLYAFWDFGATFDIDSGDQPARRTGASAGAGVRFGVTDYATGYIEVAKPMTRSVALEDNGNDARIFFRISTRF